MQVIYFIWSLMLLAVWVVIYLSAKSRISKREMLKVSLWTSLLGLTEPIFVPEYWNPPSLFDLAQRIGFDIESLIFAFSVGGLAVIIYELIFKTRHEMMPAIEKRQFRHRYHLLALFSAPIIFIFLLIFTDINPIYSAFMALIGGGFFTWYCRPDLKKKMIVSAFIFLGVYFLFFLSLVIVFPGYIGQVWNLAVISGILIVGVPVEELMFAFGLGFLWSSVYEHVKWYKIS